MVRLNVDPIGVVSDNAARRALCSSIVLFLAQFPKCTIGTLYQHLSARGRSYGSSCAIRTSGVCDGQTVALLNGPVMASLGFTKPTDLLLFILLCLLICSLALLSCLIEVVWCHPGSRGLAYSKACSA